MQRRREDITSDFSGSSHLGPFPMEKPFWWERLQQGSVLIDGHRLATPRGPRLPGCEHVRNWLAVPLRAGGELIGLYSLDKAEPGFFTTEHVRLAEALAGQGAVAIANARLYEQSRRDQEALRASEERFLKAFQLQPGRHVDQHPGRGSLRGDQRGLPPSHRSRAGRGGRPERLGDRHLGRPRAATGPDRGGEAPGPRLELRMGAAHEVAASSARGCFPRRRWTWVVSRICSRSCST